MDFYILKSKPKNNNANLPYNIDYGLIHTLIPFGNFIDLEIVIQGTR
jgi:hypothetical protein